MDTYELWPVEADIAAQVDAEDGVNRPVFVRYVRAEDVEESELARVDAEFLRDYGPQAGWKTWQWEQYEAALGTVHQQFTPGQVAA